MRIFFSHSSDSTKFVKTIQSHFPDSVRVWIDVDNLVVADEITKTLSHTIQANTDYVLLFVDEKAAHSEWVRQEIEWALKEEEELNRIILVPVVLDQHAWCQLAIPRVKQRKYTNCCGVLDPEKAARQIINDLMALLWKEVGQLRDPRSSPGLGVVADADRVLSRSASIVSSIVFPYRKNNPLSAARLVAAFEASGFMPGLRRQDFDLLLKRLLQQEMLPGLIYDGDSLYIEEEHYRWKQRLSSQQKAMVAKAAAKIISSNSIIYLDSGSATEALVEAICHRVETGSLRDIRVVTNSTRAVSRLLETDVQICSDASKAPIQVYVTGGVVRPNTLAIVGHPDPGFTDFTRFVLSLGRGDVAFVGVNGIDYRAGNSYKC